MEISEKGLAILKKFEGCKLTAYKPVPTEKYFTIGFGHMGADVKQGMKITQQQAEDLLKKDLKIYENYVMATKLNLNQNQFDSLVVFCYNCGKGGLQMLVKNRSLAQIADAILLYNKAGGKVLNGLIKRRQAERELFLKPIVKSLPYEVKTTCELNIRTAAGTNYPVVRVAKKGEILKVWAVCTSGGLQWGKNGNEWYCLKYCEEI